METMWRMSWKTSTGVSEEKHQQVLQASSAEPQRGAYTASGRGGLLTASVISRLCPGKSESTFRAGYTEVCTGTEADG